MLQSNLMKALHQCVACLLGYLCQTFVLLANVTLLMQAKWCHIQTQTLENQKIWKA
jgi:hypothetical protein